MVASNSTRQARGLRFSLVAACAAGTILSAVASASPAHAADYRLGVQDKLRIAVYDWRSATGEAHEWAPLTGEFAVGASGDLSLPLLGEVRAADRTPPELAADIAALLQQKVGLTQPPVASVEVSQYRPFYVVGLVEKPGAYPYRPSISVLQATGLAGGVARADGAAAMQFERDAIAGRGDLRLYEADRTRMLASKARLQAELNGAKTLTSPSDLLDQGDAARAQAALQEEQLLLDAKNRAFDARSAAIRRSRDLATEEQTTLNAKVQALQEQLDSATKQLGEVRDLVAKGIAIKDRLAYATQLVAQYQSGLLDTEIAMLHTQQAVAQADSDLNELANRRRTDALAELGEVDGRLQTLDQKSDTAERMVSNAELRAPELALMTEPGAEPKIRYTIVRTDAAGVHHLPASPSDLLQPDDTLRVESADKQKEAESR